VERSRGNARARRPGRWRVLGLGQDRGVDVDDYLVPVRWSAWIDAVAQRGLGEQRQGVRLLLRHARGVVTADRGVLTASLLARVQRLAGGRQRLLEHRADLGGQPSLDDHRTVGIWIHVELAAPC
jgi:hypothetical protein